MRQNSQGTRVGFIAVVLLYLVPTAHFILFRCHLSSPDFRVYYEASESILAGKWREIYELSGPMVFRYSPATLPFFFPLALVSESTARALWVVAQLAATLAAFGFLGAAVRRVFGISREQTLRVMLVSAVLVYRYYLANLRSGQVTPFSVLLAALGVHFWFSGRHAISVAFFVERALFKVIPILWLFPVLILLLPSLRAGRSFSALLSAAVAPIVGGLALTALLFDSEAMLALPGDWLDLLFSHHEAYRSPTIYSQSLPSFLLRLAESGWFDDDAYWLAFSGGAAAIMLLSTRLWARLPWENARVQFALFASVALIVRLLTPDNYPYSNLSLVVTAAFLVASAPANRVFQACVALFALGLSIPGRDVVGSTFYEWYGRVSGPFWVRAALLLVLSWQLKLTFGKGAAAAPHRRDLTHPSVQSPELLPPA